MYLKLYWVVDASSQRYGPDMLIKKQIIKQFQYKKEFMFEIRISHRRVAYRFIGVVRDKKHYILLDANTKDGHRTHIETSYKRARKIGEFRL